MCDFRVSQCATIALGWELVAKKFAFKKWRHWCGGTRGVPCARVYWRNHRNNIISNEWDLNSKYNFYRNHIWIDSFELYVVCKYLTVNVCLLKLKAQARQPFHILTYLFIAPTASARFSFFSFSPSQFSHQMQNVRRSSKVVFLVCVCVCTRECRLCNIRNKKFIKILKCWLWMIFLCCVCWMRCTRIHIVDT